MTLFTLEDVSLAPDRLIHVSLEISCDTTFVLGPSGAGKSSLLALLAGFLKPTSGSFTAHTSVYWVPQDAGLWPGLTTLEHLEAVASDRTKIVEMVSAFDLDGCEHRPPELLSRGQQSRLSIARALLTDAECLVMDEPLAHVDPDREHVYRNIIRELIRTANRSCVIATHAPGFALAEESQSICLKSGALVCHRRTDDLYWQPLSKTEANFLGPVNWIEQEALNSWFGTQDKTKLCIRPEQLSVSPSNSRGGDSPVVVESRFFGSQEAVTLRNPVTGEERTFWHRPSGRRLAPGSPVALKIVN